MRKSAEKFAKLFSEMQPANCCKLSIMVCRTYLVFVRLETKT